MARVLLAEDDGGVRVPAVRALERGGHDVDAYVNGARAADARARGDHDIVVLDIGLPGLDGMEVCRHVRAARPSVPIIFLSAQASEMDAVAGVDAGADDYVT